MKHFPEELGKLGFVFNFITYGGHQIDGLAAEEFATALKQDGMLSLARLQRKFRLLESPYRTPQTLVGGPAAGCRADGRFRPHRHHQGHGQGIHPAPAPGADRAAAKRARRVAQNWADTNQLPPTLRVQLRPVSAGSEFLELSIWNDSKGKAANVVFADVQDRRGHRLLSIRDQNTFDLSLRRKRLMTLAHLFLIHRYKVGAVHYLSPTEDNQHQTQKMKALGFFNDVNTEAGLIIVASVNQPRISELVKPDRTALRQLIAKS